MKHRQLISDQIITERSAWLTIKTALSNKNWTAYITLHAIHTENRVLDNMKYQTFKFYQFSTCAVSAAEQFSREGWKRWAVPLNTAWIDREICTFFMWSLSFHLSKSHQFNSPKMSIALVLKKQFSTGLPRQKELCMCI